MQERKEVYQMLRKAIDEAEARGDAVIGGLSFFGGDREGGNTVQPIILDDGMTGEDLFYAFVDSSYHHGKLSRIVAQALDVPTVVLALQVADAVKEKAERESMPEEHDLFGKAPEGRE